MASIISHSIFTNTPIYNSILSERLYGMSSKADAVYSYAKNYYTLGLPTGNIGALAQVDDAVVKAIIENEIGHAIIIEFALIDMLSKEMALYPYLIAVRGFSIVDNSISIHSFVLSQDRDYDALVNQYTTNDNPVIMDDIVFSADGTTATIYYSHEYYEYHTNDEGRYTITYYDRFSETVAVDSSLYVGGTYCIAYYFLDDGTGNAISGSGAIWFYNLNDGYYPELSPDMDSFGTGAFMPVIPLRHNNVDLTTIDDDLFKTSKKLLKKLSIKIDELVATINENPDIADIDHAYIMFGVPVNTDDEVSLYYLTQYFDYLYEVQEYTIKDYMSHLIDGTLPPKTIINTSIYRSNTNPIPDASLLEHGLNIEIAFDYITSVTKVGNIGKKGFASQTITVGKQLVFTGEYSGDSQDPIQIEVEASTITFRAQINASQYKEVTVHNLVHTNYIYGNHAVTTDLRDLAESTEDEPNNNLVMPVHYGIAKKLTVMQRNDLYNNSLILILNSYVITKLKWYQTTWFKIVVMIVGIVITVFTYGGASIGWAAIMDLIFYIAMAVVIDYAFKFAVKHLGAKWATVLAIVAVIASMFVKGGKFVMPTAEACLQSVVSVMNFINKAITYTIDTVQKELLEFYADAEEKSKALDAAQDLLEMSSDLDPLMFLTEPNRPYFTVESPDAFYDRTIHTGNVGTVVLDVINNYCDIMLKLPEPAYS